MARAIDWTPVDEAVAADTIASYQIALLEAAKLLEQRLKEERVSGKTFAERVTNGRLHFTRPAELEKAVAYVEALRSGHTKALTKQRAETLLQSFRQAVADMNDLSQARDSWQAQLKLYLGQIRGKRRWISYSLIAFGAFFTSVLILADTAPGQLLVIGVVESVHFFFKWVIILIITVAMLLAAVLGSALILDRQRGGRIKEEPDDHH